MITSGVVRFYVEHFGIGSAAFPTRLVHAHALPREGEYITVDSGGYCVKHVLHDVQGEIANPPLVCTCKWNDPE